MFFDLLPFSFQLDTVLIAGASLWALALYLSFARVRHWIEEGLNRWFNFAERSLYLSQQEFERTRQARESQNAFYAAIFATIPFLGAGLLCNYGMEISLGRSWAISLGILACVSCGVYELGRRSGS
ncbi:hypothetical protein PN462_12220 [Spirulina sp. CS-785/01]|uniref:hypothetical protein n=1 Tax=Spirulina sp. CS-785/01 TaxID=3021716 RepID=UPI00232AC0B3|nr:hypothetical protein [Spirulina sp. CS-785/01]MDB9313869.1 hypothetical protein [Spirulina sp. CS-785/01]